MSHIPFPGSTLSCTRIWALLEQIDAAEADRWNYDPYFTSSVPIIAGEDAVCPRESG